jgi:hypothetical protein
MSTGEPLDLRPYPIDNAIALSSAADDLEALAREIAVEREALVAEVKRLAANNAALVAAKGGEFQDGYQAGCSMSHSLGCDAVEGHRDQLVEENAALRAERDRLRDELGAALEQLHIQRGES